MVKISYLQYQHCTCMWLIPSLINCLIISKMDVLKDSASRRLVYMYTVCICVCYVHACMYDIHACVNILVHICIR